MKVAIAVLIYQNQFLICKRKGKYAGFYEFPGGKIEKNETSLDAIKRELNEELNLNLNNLKYFKSYENVINQRLYQLEVYYTFLDTNKITSNIHDNLIFITVNQLPFFSTFKNVNTVIQDLIKEKIIQKNPK